MHICLLVATLDKSYWPAHKTTDYGTPSMCAKGGGGMGGEGTQTITFILFNQNICCGYSKEPSQ